MENKKEIDSVTILCILAILLLIVIMVLPPMLRVLVNEEREVIPTPTPVVVESLTLESINSISNNGLVDCNNVDNTKTLYYKDLVIYQVKDTIKYSRVTDEDIDNCNQKVELYKNTDGISGLCEYESGNFVATFIYNFNSITGTTTDLPIEKNSNIKDVLKKYLEDNYTCYMK